jgi:hypothetical protein
MVPGPSNNYSYATTQGEEESIPSSAPFSCLKIRKEFLSGKGRKNGSQQKLETTEKNSWSKKKNYTKIFVGSDRK